MINLAELPPKTNEKSSMIGDLIRTARKIIMVLLEYRFMELCPCQKILYSSGILF